MDITYEEWDELYKLGRLVTWGIREGLYHESCKYHWNKPGALKEDVEWIRSSLVRAIYDL